MDFRITVGGNAAARAADLVDQVHRRLMLVDRSTAHYRRILSHQNAARRHLSRGEVAAAILAAHAALST